MSRKIIVLNDSPRPKGNTSIWAGLNADTFWRAASSNIAKIERYRFLIGYAANSLRRKFS